MRRVLVLPSFYPTPERPRVGGFFREHVRMMRGAGWCVDVAFVEPRSVRDLSLRAVRESHFQRTTTQDAAGSTFRLRGWNPAAQTYPGGRLWAHLLARLVDAYVAERGAPDAIHAHNALWAGEAARMSADRHHVPFIVTEHSSAVLMRELSAPALGCARRAWLAADATTAVSSSLADVMREVGAGNVRLTPNPVDTDFFVPRPVGEAAPTGRRFVTVANLNANKRVDHLLRAFGRVAQHDSTAELVVVGDGPLRRELEQLATALNVASRVEFAGSVEREGVRGVLWSATCFVSTSNFETFGIAIAEALSTGLPVVATRSAGPQDIITANTGVFVDRDDVDQLSAAMLAAPVSDAAGVDVRRASIVKRYAPAVVAETYERIYLDVVGE